MKISLPIIKILKYFTAFCVSEFKLIIIFQREIFKPEGEIFKYYPTIF